MPVSSGHSRETFELMTRKGGERLQFAPRAYHARKESVLTLKRFDAGHSVVVALVDHGLQFTRCGGLFPLNRR